MQRAQVQDLAHDFWKKISQSQRYLIRGTRRMAPKSLSKAYKKIVYQNLQIFQPLNLPSFGLVVYRHEHIYLEKAGILKRY